MLYSYTHKGGGTMELRVLRYFMTIAREGSITSAANVLHVTQPTLSRQIRDLENELGQKLFIRGSHHMTLTAEGMVLRKRAEEILSMVDKTEAEFHAMESTVSGDIYIGSRRNPGDSAYCRNCKGDTGRPSRHPLSSVQRKRGRRNRTFGQRIAGLWHPNSASRHLQI